MDSLTPREVAGGPSPRAQRVARVVLALAITLLGLWILSDFLPPLIWAAIFAIATWPLYHRVVGAFPQHQRVLVPALTTVLVGVLFVAPLAYVAGELGREAMRLVRLASNYERDGMTPPDWLAHVPVVGGYVSQWWQANLSDPRSAVLLLGRIDQSMVLTWTRTLGAQVLRRGSDLVFTLLTLFFLYRDGEVLTDHVHAAYHRVFGESGERLGTGIVAAIRGTVNGLILVGLGEGVALGLAYWALGVPNPALLGALTAVVASIPFGAFVVFGSSALALLAQGEPGHAIALMVVGLAVLIAADQFVRPMLISGAARLPFIWVLFGIVGGLETIGLLGMFVGPVVMGTLILMWREVTATPSPESAMARPPPPG